MGHTNLKQRLDGLISNFEELQDDEKATEALEHLRQAKDSLVDWNEPQGEQGQPA